MRLIARQEKPHPGAQLRITDTDGWRLTVFATNTTGGNLADLEVRHRLRARAEDRIRALKDSGLRNLPLHGFDQNQIWLETVLLAAELTTWTETIAFTGQPARRWEPKRLRLRVFAVAGRMVHTGCRSLLHLPRDWPWVELIAAGHTRLAALPLTLAHDPTTKNGQPAARALAAQHVDHRPPAKTQPGRSRDKITKDRG